MVRSPSADFWAGKHVLLTGHTGFKGAWLALWLARLGAHVTGLSLEPDVALNPLCQLGMSQVKQSSVCDIRDPSDLQTQVAQSKPDIVLHLAAQALVRESYANPLDSYATNVMGTANVLNAIRFAPGVRVAVMVTTDKVYRNEEWVHPYRESDVLGGHDPYSASKAAAELVVDSFRSAYLESLGVAVATARAGNVIGGGDWASDRLIPDAIRAWSRNGELAIRRSQSGRPWQYSLEPLCGYLLLAEALWSAQAKPGAYNFGPSSTDIASVGDVAQMARAAYGKGTLVIEKMVTGPHEAGLLALDSAKALAVLGHRPRWCLSDAVRKTMDWYRLFGEGHQAVDLCQSDINAFEATV